MGVYKIYNKLTKCWEELILNFKGQDGDPGEQGPPGPKGEVDYDEVKSFVSEEASKIADEVLENAKSYTEEYASEKQHTHHVFDHEVHFEDNIHLCGNTQESSDDSYDTWGGMLYFGDDRHFSDESNAYIGETTNDVLTIYSRKKISLDSSEIVLNGRDVVKEIDDIKKLIQNLNNGTI